MTWRISSLEIINARVELLLRDPDWHSPFKTPIKAKERQIKKVIDEDYPFSERMGAAYTGWLQARAEIFTEWGIPTRRTRVRPPSNRKGWKPPVPQSPGQLSLF